MTFAWTRDGMALVSVCQLCGMSTRSLSESAIYATQRAHSWQECARRRAEAAQAVAEPDDVERCPEGHERAGNTSTDKSGYIRCLACRREKWAAKRRAELLCATTVFGVVLGVETGRMGSAMTNRPTRERRTVLSTPSATNGKEAVDS